MKKIIFLLLCSVTLSCSVDDNSSNSYQELLPIESVMLPEQFTLNQTYEITLSYINTTDCHVFNDIYYLKENNTRTLSVITTVFLGNGPCSQRQDELQASFNFTASNTSPYTFKFWKGKDNNGEDIYLTVEVPVVE